MNVIFLDFDGVLDTHNMFYFDSNGHSVLNYDLVRSKIKILADICHEFDCKVVIEAACKDAIDEDTLETESEWVTFIFDTFREYGIECVGRTPSVNKYYSEYSYVSMWKEDEIRLYLFRHPEIEHFCVIDDDDNAIYNNSDLNKVRDHLVVTQDYCDTLDKEGLLESHKEEVGKVLKKVNKYQKYAINKSKKDI